jgi:hypothetical protein
LTNIARNLSGSTTARMNDVKLATVKDELDRDYIER